MNSKCGAISKLPVCTRVHPFAPAWSDLIFENHSTGFQKVVSCILGALPPSESAKMTLYAKSQLAYSIHDGHYKEDRPRTNVAPPVELFHPAFGHFLDNIKSTDPIPNNIMCQTTEYMKVASTIYDSKWKHVTVLTPILCKILGVNIQCIVLSDKTNPDGIVELLLMWGTW